MSKPLEEWEPEISWDMTAKRYADILAKTRRTALSVGALKEKDQLYEKIGILIEKCRSAEFQIAVVGVLKAGKSMLMNALIGEELATVGLNSTTAALTKFRSSSSGNYIKVRFYAATEWQKLVDSARGSAGSQARKGEDTEDRSLAELLADPEVQKAAEQWVGHKTIYKKCGDIPKLRDEIKRWTAADSPDHLFASEVEVGVDRKLFDMPEEVVFVDTPGLHDPVKYRSNITKEYIARANAVLVAVKPDALTEEAFQTITTVFDHVGNNKRKVFIVGTQKDKLQSSKEYEELTAGKDGWIEQLVRAKCYKNAREADAQIITTSAYLHLCMKRALTLSEADLQEEDKFSTRDYNNLENWIKNTLIRRSYPLENLRNDTETIRLLSVELGMAALRQEMDELRAENELLRTEQAKQVEKTIQSGMEDIRQQIARLQQILMPELSSAAQDRRDDRALLGELLVGFSRLEEQLGQLLPLKEETTDLRGIVERLSEKQNETIKALANANVAFQSLPEMKVYLYQLWDAMKLVWINDLIGNMGDDAGEMGAHPVKPGR